jgi:hypothetical protein
MRPLLTVFVFAALLPLACPPASAQEDRAVVDVSNIPAEAKDVKAFAPPGWVVEEEVRGDLDADSVPDVALKIIQEKPAGASDDEIVERQRALVILLAGADGTLRRAAVAPRLLQCTACGGAFYGFVEAPANVKIEKGVVVVEQDHGSREVTDVTFRVRRDPATSRFVLIGFDLASNDRATGSTVSESTNYLTGARVVTRGTKRATSKVRAERIDVERIDDERFEGDALHRLGLD